MRETKICFVRDADTRVFSPQTLQRDCEVSFRDSSAARHPAQRLLRREDRVLWGARRPVYPTRVGQAGQRAALLIAASHPVDAARVRNDYAWSQSRRAIPCSREESQVKIYKHTVLKTGPQQGKKDKL